jgi:ubiquinol-cytochrome c reductase cytochrome b subunit
MSGVLLALFYVRGASAWDSVVEISREIFGGWMVRLIHMNTASYVFLVLFIHFFRSIIQRSFSLVGPWASGWLLMLISIAAAFLGYVLPWGQISFWGATVIINLIRILPKGGLLVIWLWGGFYVSNYTCRFFYAFHFLLPLLSILLIIAHLILLHYSGRRRPGGVSRSNRLKIKFSQFFLYKDLVNLILIWSILTWMLFSPDWSRDPVNFIPSDTRSSPIHIQPEWYFLHFYAILRSIPNKLGGLVGFFLAIFLLLALSFYQNFLSLRQFKIYNFFGWLFIRTNVFLMWLGIQAVEEPFIVIGQITSLLYFRYIFVTALGLRTLFKEVFH